MSYSHPFVHHHRLPPLFDLRFRLSLMVTFMCFLFLLFLRLLLLLLSPCYAAFSSVLHSSLSFINLTLAVLILLILLLSSSSAAGASSLLSLFISVNGHEGLRGVLEAVLFVLLQSQNDHNGRKTLCWRMLRKNGARRYNPL